MADARSDLLRTYPHLFARACACVAGCTFCLRRGTPPGQRPLTLDEVLADVVEHLRLRHPNVPPGWYLAHAYALLRDRPLARPQESAWEGAAALLLAIRQDRLAMWPDL